MFIHVVTFFQFCLSHLNVTFEERDERLRAEMANLYGCELSLALYVDVAYKTMLELRASIEATAPEKPLFFREFKFNFVVKFYVVKITIVLNFFS